MDNLTLKPWTADATASGEWLQFRARLEERWQVGRHRAGACPGCWGRKEHLASGLECIAQP